MSQISVAQQLVPTATVIQGQQLAKQPDTPSFIPQAQASLPLQQRGEVDVGEYQLLIGTLALASRSRGLWMLCNEVLYSIAIALMGHT